jgi:hypoxanthine phosphoribosyltransferase
VPSDPSVPAEPRVLLTAEQIDAIVARLAAEMSARYPDGVVLIGVLRGSVPFLADLARAMTVPVSVDFMAITPYTPGSGRVRLLKDLDLDIAGRDAVIVEDIVDTGLSTAFLRSELERRRPRSVAVCTLLDRRIRRVVPVEIDFAGDEVSDSFVIGFGLDHEGRYRNLRLVAAADMELLAEDPDAYVPVFYGSSSNTRQG